MSTEILTAFAITWSAIGALLYMLWGHHTRDADREKDHGKITEAVRTLQREVGNRDSGLIKSVHDFKAEIRKALLELHTDDDGAPS